VGPVIGTTVYFDIATERFVAELTIDGPDFAEPYFASCSAPTLGEVCGWLTAASAPLP
jgi:hypothetical protein